MTNDQPAPTILIAEDDLEDRLLIQKAFREVESSIILEFVDNGEDLMTFLETEGAGKGLPDLILMDLNMPIKGGRETLAILKGQKAYMSIPVIVLTTSKSTEDIKACYALGANSYISKPARFDALKGAVKNLVTYWFHTASRAIY